MVPAGGGGRRCSEHAFFFGPNWFLGIPGSFSQENGIPLNLRGVLIGLNGGNSSAKENVNDPKEESQESDGETDENEGVRRADDGRNIGVEWRLLPSSPVYVR